MTPQDVEPGEKQGHQATPKQPPAIAEDHAAQDRRHRRHDEALIDVAGLNDDQIVRREGVGHSSHRGQARATPQRDHKHVEPYQIEQHKQRVARQGVRQEAAQIVKDVYYRRAIRVVMRHAAEHARRPVGVLAGFQIVIRDVFSPALSAVYVALHQPLTVEQFRCEIDRCEREKQDHHHHVRPSLLDCLIHI